MLIAILFGLFTTSTFINDHYEYNFVFAWTVAGIPALIGLVFGNLLGSVLFPKRSRKRRTGPSILYK
jgi:hypothetical protein